MTTIRHSPGGSLVSGPYSPAIELRFGGLRMLQVSGQGSRDPVSGARILGPIGIQARAAMDNLRNVVEGSGFSMADIVKVTLFLTDLADLPEVNGIYASYFPGGAYPARSAVSVSALPGGQAIEIDAMAARPE